MPSMLRIPLLHSFDTLGYLTSTIALPMEYHHASATEIDRRDRFRPILAYLASPVPYFNSSHRIYLARMPLTRVTLDTRGPNRR